MNICLIPARIGSKRIKNKNIINFFGKPIISYTIKTAIKSKLFDKIVVSTDSKKIAHLSKKYGAEIPFIRPKKISNDTATDTHVIGHFINHCKKKKIHLKTLCYVYPSNPLLKISTLKKCKKILNQAECTRVITISKFSNKIERSLVKNKKNFIDFKIKKNKNKRSQDFEESYHDAAQCYWFNIKRIKNIKKIKKNTTKAVELKKFEFVDLDTKDDLINLKKIYKSKLHYY